MADNDKTPLLLEVNEDNEDQDPVVFVQTRPDGIQKMSSIQSEILDVSNDRSSDRSPKEHSLSKRRRHHRHNREIIVAIFIVAFDTKKGNVVEWSYPEEISLDGLEFKAMASGFHTVTSDFIYFKQNQLYGVSCYEKIDVDNIEERGARMRSVGLLASSYSNLHTHMGFLRQQAKLRLENQDYDYEDLSNYFWEIQSPRQQLTSTSSLATADLPHMEITHPSGCFNQFLQFFGPTVFALWRLALLRKRILIFSPPPIGVICYRVYCTSVLASHNIDNLDMDTELNPLFFVNVADIDKLSEEISFVACTTEKIFESKKDLYDIYIDNHTILTSSTRSDPFLRLTQADHQRFTKISNTSSSLFSFTRTTSSQVDEDLACARYFQQLNTELYTMLMEAHTSEDHLLTIDMIQALGLDPDKDRIFLTELATLHRLNVTVQRQADMFSCCI